MFGGAIPVPLLIIGQFTTFAGDNGCRIRHSNHHHWREYFTSLKELQAMSHRIREHFSMRHQYIHLELYLDLRATIILSFILYNMSIKSTHHPLEYLVPAVRDYILALLHARLLRVLLQRQRDSVNSVANMLRGVPEETRRPDREDPDRTRTTRRLEQASA
ncbi:Uncharacterized protein HZ326_24427 [Fusarium oxysporum f. sp. albedinis]|nr:Uncharacterized protein HZ326_24427 [Fusarium oxysporum f. sp. albedinis]